MKTFSIKEAYKRGWEIWKQHKKIITIATVITAILGLLPEVDGSDFSILVLVFSILSFIINMGWTKMLIRTIHGEVPQVRDLIDHIGMVWKYLGMTIIVCLIVIVGLILFIIPGVYFMIKYFFASTIVLDRNSSIKEALRESARMTQGVKWKLIGFAIVGIFVNIIGLLMLGVGLLVTIPVTTLAYLSIYKELSQKPQVETEVVPQVAE